MVEASANEASEEQVLEGLRIAHDEIKKLIAAQLALRELAGKPKWEVPTYDVDRALYDEIVRRFGAEVESGHRDRRQEGPPGRHRRAAPADRGVSGGVDDADLRERLAQVKRAFAQLEKDVIRRRIAVDKRRPDGRARRRDQADHAARSASCRARTARPCSRAARRRP